jgi:hypothetical protein
MAVATISMTDKKRSVPGRVAGHGELPLTRGERLVLALGLHIACAVIAVAERHSVRHGRHTTRSATAKRHRLPNKE